MAKKKPEQIAELEVVIGRHVKEIRESAGVPRELVAVAARMEGLPWQTNTLSLIEVGRRRVTTGELFLLPHVLTTVIPEAHHPLDEETERRRPFHLFDLIPEGTEMALTPHRTVWGWGLRKLICEQGVYTSEFQSLSTISRLPSLADEVTGRAARAMRTSVSVVGDAACAIWSCSFIDERDRRLKALITDKTPPRRVGALRGHVSRELMQELRDHLNKQKGGKQKGKQASKQRF